MAIKSSFILENIDSETRKKLQNFNYLDNFNYLHIPTQFSLLYLAHLKSIIRTTGKKAVN